MNEREHEDWNRCGCGWCDAVRWQERYNALEALGRAFYAAHDKHCCSGSLGEAEDDFREALGID